MLETRDKVRFNPSVIDENLYTRPEITTKWGGDIEFVYEHDKYWPALLSLTEKRRSAEQAQWHELGGTVGISEWDIKSVLRGLSSETLETTASADGPLV